jgi:hypothetical protein
MNDTRKIVGVFGAVTTVKKGIAFPTVRAWIRGPNDYVTTDLLHLFPDRGTVFLYTPEIDSPEPQLDQVGLFNCVKSPGQTAEWRVKTASSSLARVIEYPHWDANPKQLALWQWLVKYRDASACSLYAEHNHVYIRRKDCELIGPLTIMQDGKVVANEPTFLYKGLDSFSITIAKRLCCFVDTELLPQGEPLVLDPHDAIRRRLKLAHNTGRLNWLSRAKVQELSTILSSADVDRGSEWVMEVLPGALEEITLGGRVDETLVSAILEVERVSSAVESRWTLKHADKVSKANAEIEALNKTASDVGNSINIANARLQSLMGEISGLEKSLLELDEKCKSAKDKAAGAFDDELKRLAQSPASMALLSKWCRADAKETDRARPLIKIQSGDNNLNQAVSLSAAILANLKGCGLAPTCAAEVTAVCIAALSVGLPISVRSLCADLVVESVTCALGQPFSVWVDVPAGILDPIDWSAVISEDQAQSPIIFQLANRSDLQLVLGSLRTSMLRQAIGFIPSRRVVFLTLESSADMQVQSEFHLGPLIDDRILRFNNPKTAIAKRCYSDYANTTHDNSDISEEGFEEIGDNLISLPMFAISAQKAMYRRAYGALKIVCGDPLDVERLFFKYWCLPRITTQDALTIIEAHKESWGQDSSLCELRQALASNE